jgi:hypothetical protein
LFAIVETVLQRQDALAWAWGSKRALWRNI